MAAPLRYPLILLAWGAMAAIYLPLLPAAGNWWRCALPANWRALFADPQLSRRWPPPSSPRCYPSAARC
ncbi:Inner membrane ABC transporter permease protein YnjC [Klebsiella pneumoniae]|nr:Inner membrane ABC transporter permease protein YnjC [Klebsiella pneumoniae]